MEERSKNAKARFYARLGAGLFVAWGLLHVLGGAMILASSLSDAGAALRDMASGAAAGDVGAGMSPVAGALLSYHAFNLTWLGALVALIGATLNWRNDGAGFWLNFSIVGMVDLGLAVWFLRTGYITLSEGLIGVTLFAGAALISGAARWMEGRSQKARAFGKNMLAEAGAHP